jgi:hypothetical protein
MSMLDLFDLFLATFIFGFAIYLLAILARNWAHRHAATTTAPPQTPRQLFGDKLKYISRDTGRMVIYSGNRFYVIGADYQVESPGYTTFLAARQHCDREHKELAIPDLQSDTGQKDTNHL